jgi:hypothetical protein
MEVVKEGWDSQCLYIPVKLLYCTANDLDQSHEHRMSGLPDVVYYRFRYRGKPLGEGKSPRKLQATALAIIEKEQNTHWRKW